MQTTAPCSLHKPLSLAGVWIQIVPSFRTRGMIRGTIITKAAQHDTEQRLLISFTVLDEDESIPTRSMGTRCLP